LRGELGRPAVDQPDLSSTRLVEPLRERLHVRHAGLVMVGPEQELGGVGDPHEHRDGWHDG
jgi:hypothetical protein